MVEHATQCANEFHAKYNALNNSSQPRRALVHPMVRNMSLCTNGGLHVVGSGSSKPNPSENKIIEGDIPAKQGQLSPICDSSSMNVLNEHISTASVERIVETQPALSLETHRTNVERGNILNGNSVHRTNGVDAESSPNYNTQVRPGSGGGGYYHERFPGSFPPRDTHGWSRPRRPPPPSYRPGPIIFTFYYGSCY